MVVIMYSVNIKTLLLNKGGHLASFGQSISCLTVLLWLYTIMVLNFVKTSWGNLT